VSQFPILRDAPEEGLLAIQLGSTLDNSNVHQLATMLKNAQEDDYKKIILDCSRLEFVASAGIGVIVSKNRSFRSKGCELILFDVPEIVMFVLNELDVADLLTIRSNLSTFMTTG
jgi:anti-sigma B factor antagonist